MFNLKDNKSDIEFKFLLPLIYEEEILPSFEIEDQTAIAGYLFELKLDFPGVSFEDNTYLFDISSDGVISFTPEKEDVGEHLVGINIITDNEKYSTTFLLNITWWNTAPEIDYIGYLYAENGKRFEYQVIASDDDLLTFTDDSELFDINSTGYISFTPLEEGAFEATITAIDSKGEKDSEIIIIIVTE